ncbi:MAG: RNA polymerase sigma factor [Nannocystaceae bacterium]|nr:RNA polymerase sigma factor [Nannocystaceae bacterium]
MPRGAAVDDDEALVERARRHDAGAWAQLYRRHYAGLYRHVHALVGRANVAEDLTQETFARALVALPSFTGRSSVATWLHGIALNLARTDWRSLERASRAHAELARMPARDEHEHEGEHALARSQRTALLYVLLDQLSASLREAFVLRYVEGMSAAEAATALGIEPGAVRVRAHRAREQIEAALARVHADAARGGDP